MFISLDDVKNAAEKIKDDVYNTRQRRSITLSKITNADVYLKFENRQFTASFKERGALNRLLNLSDEEKASGVIAMSAGNHAQGVSFHAARLGIPATIVMPRNTPTVKVEHTEAHGANVILYGLTLAEAATYAHEKAIEEDLTFIHPYDDADVIAGQGTVALEILEQFPDIQDLIIPIGGGGLISGIAVAAKTINPDIRVFGVQTALYPSMKQILNKEVPVCGGSTIAEGIAVKYPGENTRKIVEELVDDILLVTENELESAISLLLNVEKTVVEGAGAAGLAAVIGNKQLFEGRKVAMVLTGGNIDQRLLATVLMRDMARSGRLARLRIHLMDRPCALADVSRLIGDNGGNIVEISHQRIFTHVPAKDTSIEVAIETRDASQLEKIVGILEAADFPVSQL
ncbi:threonine ammonia-lyase [Curvivirga sp.]|uniref:threonine ammonia-lyase n=1 Tax=Curvivirga sp. TaxID=2856848 RepID=UPI003B5BDB04